jgi:hypothetical protein
VEYRCVPIAEEILKKLIEGYDGELDDWETTDLIKKARLFFGKETGK